MDYFGEGSDVESTNFKTGVLLINLGSPDRPVCPGLRKYLSEFLQDRRIIELPKFFRWLLVKVIIINFRAHKSARNYRKIWTDQGSPLLLNTQSLAQATQRVLGDAYYVDFAMRYGNPSIKNTLQQAHRHRGIRKWVIIPLYPQYSGSTNGSTFDAISKAFMQFRWVPQIHFISSYFDNPNYIKAIANSVRCHWQNNGQAEQLIMSFHGIPEQHVKQGDPYQEHCRISAEKIAQELSLSDKQWMLVFQSRFGAQEWLQPYCDKTLATLPAQGIKSIDIICPGFSADCLETLEEINQENRDIFMLAGGESYHYIPCLNNHASHAELMANIVSKS